MIRYRLWRLFWKLTYHFNWHYMEVIGPLADGRKQAWCKWCGLRDWVFDYDVALTDIRIASARHEWNTPKNLFVPLGENLVTILDEENKKP